MLTWGCWAHGLNLWATLLYQCGPGPAGIWALLLPAGMSQAVAVPREAAISQPAVAAQATAVRPS